MRPISTFIALATILPFNAASAQQTPSPPAEMSPGVKQMCREEVQRICRPGLLPNRPAIQRCVAAHKDKFPKQCQPMLQSN